MFGLRISTLCIAALLGVGAANAQTFSYTIHLDTTGAIVIPNGSGPPSSAVNQKGVGETIEANGTRTSFEVTGITWSTAGGDLSSNGVGQITDKDGSSYGVVYWCVNARTAEPSGDCVAKIVGEIGRYKGRLGTGSWHFALKGTKDTTVGTGTWN